MMLKKQTVWLLTMLSLVVVLSVYYINGAGTDQTSSNVDNEQVADFSSDENVFGVESGTTISYETKDEAFENIRAQMRDSRARTLEQLTNMAASNELSAEEKSKAKDEMDKIHEMAEKEKLIEQLIVSTLGYEDALVRANGEEVFITVKGQEPSKAKAVEIIQMVNKEMGTLNVSVSYQDGNETK